MQVHVPYQDLYVEALYLLRMRKPQEVPCGYLHKDLGEAEAVEYQCI